MPSPFPGIDPFIEGQIWMDFHAEFVPAIRAALNQVLPERYVVRIEEYVYLDLQREDDLMLVQPDVIVLEEPPSVPATTTTGSTATAVAAQPAILTLPLHAQRRQRFLTIRKRQTQQVVTVIELLSPTNERANSLDQAAYLEKREEILRSPAHLVELDLLRGGARLPTVEPLPAGDYYVYVARAQHRPAVEVYA